MSGATEGPLGAEEGSSARTGVLRCALRPSLRMTRRRTLTRTRRKNPGALRDSLDLPTFWLESAPCPTVSGRVRGGGTCSACSRHQRRDAAWAMTRRGPSSAMTSSGFDPSLPEEHTSPHASGLIGIRSLGVATALQRGERLPGLCRGGGNPVTGKKAHQRPARGGRTRITVNQATQLDERAARLREWADQQVDEAVRDVNVFAHGDGGTLQCIAKQVRCALKVPALADIELRRLDPRRDRFRL